jgi:hypothetical protein
LNGNNRITFITLLVVVLTACAAPAQIPPTPVEATSTPIPPTAIPATPTQIPPTPQPTSTPIPPTAIPATTSPTKSNFINALVYDLPEMYDVNVETVLYPTINGTSDTLKMDIFYPPDRKPGELLPAVILVNGFPNNQNWNKRTWDPLQSWGHLIAASGLIAVTYDTHNKNDLDAVIENIQKKGADLGIDGSKLGLWSASSSSGLASNYAFQEDRKYLKFAVFYYAWIMTPDNFERELIDESCVQYGCLGSQLPDVKQLRTDLPLLVVRCGQDAPDNNAIVDHFIEVAKKAGVPMTLIRFDEGAHAFDQISSGAAKVKAIKIIKQTLEFMKQHAYDP